eukprot:GHVU01224423.1.p2 GENE.GHVU01224423.1~~GHVU01224423.1.p2  ORF type:complete len:104 (-),score=11.24 GHVU01224423.1:959-1270(-)
MLRRYNGPPPPPFSSPLPSSSSSSEWQPGADYYLERLATLTRLTRLSAVPKNRTPYRRTMNRRQQWYKRRPIKHFRPSWSTVNETEPPTFFGLSLQSLHLSDK